MFNNQISSYSSYTCIKCLPLSLCQHAELCFNVICHLCYISRLTNEQFKKQHIVTLPPVDIYCKFHALVQQLCKKHEYWRNDCANLLLLNSMLEWLASSCSYN